MESPEQEVSDLVQMFEDAEESTYSARSQAEIDRDYFDGKQLTAEEKAELNKRGQPPITFNLIKTKVNYAVGLEVEQRTDPKAFPRTPDDEEAAQAATDALRYVQDTQDLPSKFSDVFENLYIEGLGGVEVTVEETKRGPQIVVKRWKWDRIFYDPHSSEADFTDATYMGGVIWMDYDRAVKRWSGKEEVLQQTLMNAPGSVQSETYDDKPKYKLWSDNGKRKRIRIVQMYYLDGGEWYWCIFTYGGKLEGDVVPYLDEDGDTECPMILQSAYVDRDNDRYGETRSLRDVQDEVNKRRSKIMHLGMMRQTAAEQGAIDDVRKMKAELAKADGHITYKQGRKFEVLPTHDQIKTQADLLMHAEQRFDLMGPNAAMQGKGEKSASGRAIQANQQGGMVEQANLFKRRYKHFKTRVYRAIWNRIRQYWTEEKWIRVTDNDDNVKFVGLNREMTVGEVMLKQAEKQLPPDQLAMLQQQIAQDPRSQQPSGQKENVPAEMDMDVIVDEGPDLVTIQQEQFAELVDLARAGVQFPPVIYIKASQLRDKDELIEVIKGGQTPEQQQMAQKQAELQERAANAEILEKETSAERNRASALKTTAEAEQTMMETESAPV